MASRNEEHVRVGFFDLHNKQRCSLSRLADQRLPSIGMPFASGGVYRIGIEEGVRRFFQRNALVVALVGTELLVVPREPDADDLDIYIHTLIIEGVYTLSISSD